MSISISDLRKSRTTDFSSITKALTKTNEGRQDDADFFKLEKDKAGNASAVIRFLPKHPDDELPFVTVYSHAFQGPSGRWYIENSRTTIGEPDPVSEANRVLWTGSDKDKEQARKQKRKTSYIANILVISDPKHPENEGKVMRFKFGKKIFDKIKDKAEPTFEDESPVNVFDAFDGAEFKLRMRQVEGYPNYDTSVFSEVKPLADSDEEILAIVNQMKPLKEFVDPKSFKGYDELKKKFDSVMNASAVASSARAEQVAEQMREEPVASPKAAKVVESKAPKETAAPWDTEDADSDDVESYFKSIAT